MRQLRLLLIITIGLSTPLVAAKNRAIPELLRGGIPNVQSASALVVDLNSDTTLYEKDADLVRPIASISKMIGATVIVEDCKLAPDAMHEMTGKNRDAARGGDKTKLTTGWSYSHSDLLHAALMRSDNRALPALGEACGMDPLTFGEKMTAKAKSLGLTKTHFKEPNGLSVENVSTARELMVVLRHVMKIQTITEIMGKTEYVLAAEKNGKTRSIKIRSTDRLLTKNLATILAGKTGYTDIARYCLAVAAETFSGRDIGMVFLGAEGRYTRFADFTRIIHWLGPDQEVASASAPTPIKIVTKNATVGVTKPNAGLITIPYSPLVGPPAELAPGGMLPVLDAPPEQNKW